MEQNQKLELISTAIQRLMEEKRNKEASGDQIFVEGEDDDDRLLLSKLLSQLESLNGEGSPQQAEVSAQLEEITSAAMDNMETRTEKSNKENNGKTNIGEDVVKELKKVKRQNFITHCLLSVMIVLTVTWQLSEVSFILKVKDSINHPFKSLGSFVKGMFLKRGERNGQDEEKKASPSSNQSLIEAPVLPPLKIPDLPHAFNS